MARTKATYRRSQARQRRRNERRAAIVPGEPSTTSVKAATSTHSPSVAGASADKIVDNEAAALLAKNQPSHLRNDKEMKDKPMVDTTTTMRA